MTIRRHGQCRQMIAPSIRSIPPSPIPSKHASVRVHDQCRFTRSAFSAYMPEITLHTQGRMTHPCMPCHMCVCVCVCVWVKDATCVHAMIEKKKDAAPVGAAIERRGFSACTAAASCADQLRAPPQPCAHDASAQAVHTVSPFM